MTASHSKLKWIGTINRPFDHQHYPANEEVVAIRIKCAEGTQKIPEDLRTRL